MLNLHILANQDFEGRPAPADAADCNHGDWLSTDGDAVRCCNCLSQLLMVPHKPGEFRLEWVSPSTLAMRPSRCAA
jgi:hypothetical protein